MKKKYYVILIIMVLIEVINIFLTYKSGTNKFSEEKVANKWTTFAIMLKEKDSDKYYNYIEQKWPGIGYRYNNELSNCVDEEGKTIEGIMTFNNDTRIATVRSKREAYCYLYFDYDPVPQNFKFDIKEDIEKNAIKYTNKMTPPATLSWVDDDVTKYCIFETSIDTNLNSEDAIREKCDWKDITEKSAQEISFSLKNNNNGNRIITAYIRDEAGNLVSANDTIYLDTKGPVIKVEEVPSKTLKINGYEWYQKLQITISAVDEGIGTKENALYCKNTKECEPTTEYNLSKIEPLSFENAKSKYIVKIKVEDSLGNSSNYDNNYGVDGEKPTLNFTPVNYQAGSNGWYKKMNIQITSKDNYSQINKIEYKLCNKNETKCVDASSKVINNIYTISDTPLVDGSQNPQKLCATVYDNAGNNIKGCSNDYNVDTKSPVCLVNKTLSGVSENGVTGSIECSDGISGCVKAKYDFKDYKQEEYTIEDNAGWSTTCKLPIKIEEQTADCKKGNRCTQAGCEPGASFETSYTMCDTCGGWYWECRGGKCMPMYGAYECNCRDIYEYGCNLYKENNDICGCANWDDSSDWKVVSSCTPDDKSNTKRINCRYSWK